MLSAAVLAIVLILVGFLMLTRLVSLQLRRRRVIRQLSDSTAVTETLANAEVWARSPTCR